MGINYLTIKFRDNLLELINNSGLPVCNVEMILSNTLSAVQKKLQEALKKESEAETDE